MELLVQAISTMFLFQLKHFICDFLLQTEYHLGKFKRFPDFVLPLLSHSAIQGAGTYWIVYHVSRSIETSLTFALFDLITHFVIDRIKASPNLLGRFKPDSRYFWWALGLDQLLHQVVYLLIVNWPIFVT